MLSIGLIIVVILALSFDFINGFHDTANSIATSVSTRVLSPRQAIIMAAVLNFVGAVVSSKVAKTISGGLVQGSLPEYVIIATLIAAIIWDLITWYFGIPSSSSHALIGGLIGASIVYATTVHKIIWMGVFNKVVIPLITSPFIGFALGFLVMKFLYRILCRCTPVFVERYFSKFQIFSAAFMSFEHGKNDAQKSMGIITLALFSSGLIATNDVPTWVMVACASAMAFGTSVGGWKIIKTVGVNMIRLQPIQGFAAETSAAIVISTASAIGAPVSTTHVISTAIMGVGASKRLSAVRWALAKNIVWAWILTIPTTALIGGMITWVFKLFVR
jgi:PiT family inorganic phosphate transporter